MSIIFDCLCIDIDHTAIYIILINSNIEKIRSVVMNNTEINIANIRRVLAIEDVFSMMIQKI